MIFGRCPGPCGEGMNSHETNPVIHLELHTGDMRGAVDFYSRLFGWRPERIHAGAGSYLALGMGNGVGGGVVECEAEHSLWLPYVDVPDVARTTDQAQALGGEGLLRPPQGPEGFRRAGSAPGGGEGALLPSENRRRATRRPV